MGHGYCFDCKKCHYEYDVCVGSCMLFSYTYKQIVNEIKNGVHGNNWKYVFSSRNDMVVNATKYLYICQCGNWSVEPSLSLYAPKNSNKLTKTYVMEYDLKSDYYCIINYIHICKKCGAEMYKTDITHKTLLPCPKCNNINQTSGIINWD
ncbi:MAG: hypothetical protein NC040_02415 [Muribaculaceae bacterium]|nr:hypothetical protein [Alistipes senegalensis]MCM1472884.1 hypothetical protein [Muribaculaceae bacterium]